MPFLCLSLSLTASGYKLHIPVEPILLSPLSVSPATALATHVQSHKYSRQAQMSVPFHNSAFVQATAFPETPCSLLLCSLLLLAGFSSDVFSRKPCGASPSHMPLTPLTLSWVRCPHSEYTELEITIIRLIISGLNHLCILSTEHCA